MLEIQNLTKNYGKKIALNDISYKFDTGVYGLLGPNGSGKSTIMNIIADVIPMSRGNIMYEGKQISKLGETYRECIGYLPQNCGLINNFSAYDNLKYFALLRGVPKSELDKRTDYALQSVNLFERKKDKVDSFSGGMKRRLAIAITIIADPQILIFDEPTVGLDPKERHRFKELIMDLGKTKTIILSSHIVSDIKETSTKLLILKEGVLVFDSTKIDFNIKEKYLEYFPENE